MWVFYVMITHSSGQKHMMQDTNELRAWMELHLLHGLAFGGAALCRLLQQVPESIFLFFMGAWIFVFSSPWVTNYVVSSLSSKKYPDDPIDHTTLLVVVTTGVMFFPLHFAALTQMRTKLDEMASPGGSGFVALPITGYSEEIFDEEDAASVNEQEQTKISRLDRPE